MVGINVRQYRTDAEQKMLEMREPISHKERPKASLMLQYRRDIADGTLDRKKLDADVRDGKLTAKGSKDSLGPTYGRKSEGSAAQANRP
jgi:hypothetical protein